MTKPAGPRKTRLPDGTTFYGINRNETLYLYKEIFEERSYLPPQGRFTLPERPIVIDVGANIGMFCRFAASEWPGCRIMAFEPAPPVHEVLVLNAAALTGVQVRTEALGSTTGVATLDYYPGYTIMSGFHTNPERDRAIVRSYALRSADSIADAQVRAATISAIDEMLEGRFVQETRTCDVTTISAVVAKEALPRIDLLKVDVEGAELEVLNGIDPKTWGLVGNVVVEVDDVNGRLGAILELLETAGLDTTVHQGPEYRFSPLHLVYASRQG